MNKLLDYLSNLGTAATTASANEIVLNDPKLQEQYLADSQKRAAESAQRFRTATLEDEYRKSGNFNPVGNASNNVIDAWKDNATSPEYYAGNSFAEDLGDGALAVGKGLANTVLGGARAFVSGEDSWINKSLDGISSGLGSMQSDMMQARIQDQQQEVQESDKYWDRQVSLGTVSAGDAEIGKFKDNWKSQNSSSVWDNIGQAVGSLIPIIAGGHVGAGLAIGSSFSEVNKTIYDEIYSKDATNNFTVTHEDLMKDKIYADAFVRTGDTKKARDVLYQEASNSAMFSIKNIVGTGIDFVGDKLAVKGLGKLVTGVPKFGGASRIAGRTAGETASEVAGSSARQYAAGQAMNEYNITDRDPITGIGSNAVTEIIGSIGATTAINTPGAALDATKATGRNAAKLAGIIGSSIGSKDSTEDPSPTTPEQAEESITATMNAAVAASEAMATEEPSEQNTANQNYVIEMTDALSWEDIPEGAASDGVRAALNGSRDIGDALIKAGNSILSGTNDENDAVNLALWIQDTIDETEAIVESGKLKLTELPDGSPLISLVESFSNNANIIKNQDVLTRAIAAAKDYASKLDTEIDPNAEASTQQQKVDNTVTVSRLAPEKSNLDSVNYVLEQVERGESSLPDDQVAMLKVIRDTLNKQREIDQTRADQGYSDNIDIVGREVKSDLDDGKKGLSALGHADKVIAQMRKGSVDGAKTQLETFGRFVQSHLNKVNALVESKEKGGSTVKYDTVGKNGKTFAKSKKGVKYDAPVFAHTVQNEAQLLVATYNGLIDAYPAIAASKLKEPSNSFTGPATKAKTETKTATERLREISEEVPTSPEEQNTDTTAMETPEEVSTRVAAEEVEVEAPKTSGYQEAITKANAASRAEDTAPKKAAAYISSLVSSINTASGETKDKLVAQLEKAKARRKVAKKDPEVKVEPIQEATTAVEEVVEPTEGKSTLSTETIKSYSDEKLNDEIDAYIGFHEKIGRTPDSEATLSALVAEMNIREDKAAAEIQAEEAAELSEDTVVEEVVTPEPVVAETDTGRKEITEEVSEEVVNEPVAEPVNTKADEALQEIEAKVDSQKAANNAVVTEAEAKSKLIENDEESDTTSEVFDEFGKTELAKMTNVREGTSKFQTDPEALSTLISMLESDTQNEDITSAYAKFIKSYKKNVDDTLDKALVFLSDKISKQKENIANKYSDNVPIKAEYNKLKAKLDDGTLTQEAFDKKFNMLVLVRVAGFAEGNIANLANYDAASNTFTFPTEIREAATASLVHWIVNLRNINRAKSHEDLAEVYGIPFDTLRKELTTEQMDKMVDGVSSGYAKNDLSRLITEMLGITFKSGSPIGRSKGSVDSLAAELISMLENGKSQTVTIDQISVSESIKPKVINLSDAFLKSKLFENMSLAKDTVAKNLTTNVPKPYYIGSAPKVSSNKLKNPVDQLTKRQQKVLEKIQGIPFKINTKMMSFLDTALDDSGLIELFGTPDIDSKVRNSNHKSSLAGQNNQITSSMRELRSMMGGAFEYTMGEAGGTISEVPFYYASNFSSVSRLQMAGSFTPQGSKLVRSVVSPNRAQVDVGNVLSKLTDGSFDSLTDNEKFYMLAQAQALGISIHNQTHDNSYKALSNLVTGKLAPVIEMLGKNLALPEKLNSKQIAMIKDALGGDLSELAVQALVELAEISNGDAKSNSDFTTHMYIEADGITNGPFMANMLLGADLTPEWITFMENGGMFIGRDENSNTYRGRSKDEGTVADNYQLTTNRAGQILPGIIMGWYNGNGANAATRTHVSHVNNLIANVFDHINIVDGDIVLTRNTGKNPLTVTIYGSGAAGIANKFTDQIRDFIHEVSSVLFEEENRGATPRQAQQIAAETMFPNLDSESALMKLDTINESLLATSRQHMYLKGEEQIVTLRGSKDTFPVQLYSGKRKDIASLSGNAYSNISKNIEKTLVDSLRSAMGEITPSTLFTSEKLVSLTTKHSGLARALFVKKLKAVLEAKKKAAEKGTSGGRPNDFLSQKEVNDVMKELSKFGTSIDMLGQNFSLGKTGKSYIDGVRATFGASTSGQFATDRPEVTGLQDIGVGGVPRAVIGFGDAEVIMRFIELMDEQGFTDGYQQIFDGINLSANNYKEASKLANQAVRETLFNNPLDQITDAMNDAMPKLMVELGIINEDGSLQDGISDWDSLSNTIGEDVADIIYKAYHPFPSSEPVGLDEVYAINNVAVGALKKRANKVGAVQNTLKDFKISYDQMASVGEQYVSDGKAIDSNSATDISAALFNRPAPTPESKAVVSAINTDVVFGGLVIPGVFSKLYNVLKDKIPDADKRVLANALRNAKNSNTSIIVGDLETVLQSDGITDDVRARLASGNVNGVYDHKANRIYVVNPTAETVVHEVLHANTLGTIITYYTDPSKLSTVQIQAMQNIEALMGQFQNHGMEGKTAKEMEAINHLSDILFSFESESSPNTGKIKAVAEFIAYVGSDSDLRKAGKRTSIRKDTKLAVFLNDAWQAVKSLLGLNKDAETIVENGNLYAATMYNTNIITGMNDNSSSSVVDMLLNHEKPNKDNRALIIRNGLINLVKSMEGKVTPEEVALKMAKMSVVSEEISSAFKGAGFSMNTEETQVFESLVEVMGLGYKLDTSAKNSINRLFNHTLRNIKPESFLSNPSKATPEDIETANQKYAAITGAYTKGNNTAGRTNLVSSFLALAMSNDEFAGVLNKVGLPKNNSEKAESFDDLVGNFGNGLIYRLTNKVNNIKKGDTMVSSLESLMGALLKKPEGSRSVYKTFVAPVGQVVDKANDILSEGISRLGSTAYDYGDMLQNSNGNKLVEGLGSTLKIIGGIIDKNTSGAVAEGLSSLLNNTKAPEFIKSAIFGMIGRTESNKNVYDLIKPIKAFVQKQRQMFVENTPITLNSKFKKKPTTEEAISLHKSMAKTDMASLLSVYSAEDAMRIAASDSLINRRIRDIAMQIKITDPSNEAYLHSKSEQLAEYMVTGKTGSNLRRNATAIVIGSDSTKVSAKLVDEMVTLMALRKSDLTVLRSKMKTDKEGIRFTLSYLKGQIAEELAKDTYHQINGFKGYIPSKNEGSLVVVDDSKAAAYLSRGYVRTGDYIGSRLDSDRSKRGYYYSSLSTTRPFAQGIMQNVLLSVNGVDSTNGKAIGITTGGLVDDAQVSRVASMLDKDTTEYGLMPIFNTEGEVIGLERALDPSQVSKLDAGSNLFDMIGVWRGRQAEEYTAGRYNEVSIDELLTMYQKDKGRQDEFINVLDPKELAKDKVLKESVGLIDAATITYAKEKFGGKLMVRKDMLNDVLGYRSVSVAGVFDGNNNMSKGTNNVLRDGLSLLLGKTAFSKLVKTEEVVQGLVGDAKQLIVVKSVVVPAINGLSNILHLKSRGVNADRIITGLTDKLVEVETYSNLNKREVVLEAEIRAASNNIAVRRALQAELISIRDSYKDLSIYPLLATGEFSSIVSVAIDGESTNLKKGKVAEYVEESINKMAPLQRDIAKNLFITKDTSIYQFLQKATDYGDFLAKAIYYDHLIDKGVSQEVALGKIKEEFINYDVLPGRSRGYLEKMGLLWFYNFKLRSVKVALSTMRENPVHALLSGFIPTSTVFGNTGLPMTDNIFYKMFDGSLPYSIGPGQGLNSVNLHPLVNILN